MTWALALVMVIATVVVAKSQIAEAGLSAGPSTTTVFIATGENYPDALVAGAAGMLSPVLLVMVDSIPAGTLSELERLTPENIIIVGETAVVSTAVEDALKALSWGPTVMRHGGADRYDTAAALSEATFPTTGFFGRVAHAETSLAGLGTGAPLVFLQVTLTAPADGTVVVNAGADFGRDSGENPATAECSLTQNGAHIVGSLRTIHISLDNPQEDCTTQGAFEVEAGVTYTVELTTDAPATWGIGEAALWAMWVPFDGVGAVPGS